MRCDGLGGAVYGGKGRDGMWRDMRSAHSSVVETVATLVDMEPKRCCTYVVSSK